MACFLRLYRAVRSPARALFYGSGVFLFDAEHNISFFEQIIWTCKALFATLQMNYAG